jgi:hypothetical protein
MGDVGGRDVKKCKLSHNREESFMGVQDEEYAFIQN